MAIFDYFIMVDWSGGGRRRGLGRDAIWIAHGGRNDSLPATESPYSRTEATDRVREMILANLDGALRVLLCCDFGYGFPGGFSTGLPAASGTVFHAGRHRARIEGRRRHPFGRRLDPWRPIAPLRRVSDRIPPLPATSVFWYHKVALGYILIREGAGRAGDHQAVGSQVVG
jgi:hypothetical protein